jgi:hypothetical protein
MDCVGGRAHRLRTLPRSNALPRSAARCPQADRKLTDWESLLGDWGVGSWPTNHSPWLQPLVYYDVAENACPASTAGARKRQSCYLVTIEMMNSSFSLRGPSASARQQTPLRRTQGNLLSVDAASGARPARH